MAAVVQKNGMKPLQMVNGNLSHLDGAINVKLEDGQCVIKSEAVEETGNIDGGLYVLKTEQIDGHANVGAGLYVNNENINTDLVKRECGSGHSGYLQCGGGSAVGGELNNQISEANNGGGDEPEIDIVINNVVCSFSVRCHLNLRQIALNGVNVEYRRENGMVTMKLRNPYTTASIWSSGKITCTGATSEDQARVAARKYARLLQKLGFKTRFTNYRVVNVLGTCSMPFAIRIIQFSEKHREIAEYEPELHPGVTYKLKKPKATLKIFSTGSITVTAPSVSDVQQAIEEIYPLVLEFRTERSKDDFTYLEKRRAQSRKRKLSEAFVVKDPETEEEEGAELDYSDESEADDWN